MQKEQKTIHIGVQYIPNKEQLVDELKQIAEIKWAMLTADKNEVGILPQSDDIATIAEEKARQLIDDFSRRT